MRAAGLLLLLPACDHRGSVTLGDVKSDDTASVDDSAGADTGAAAGDTGASDTAADSVPPAPVPDTTVWQGSRTFAYESDWWTCDEGVDELGAAITDEDDRALALDACPECDEVYEVGVTPDTICDYLTLSDPTYRGLVFGDGWAAVYGFSQDWDGSVQADLLDSSAEFDGWTLTYTYTVDWYGQEILVQGTLTFPELSR